MQFIGSEEVFLGVLEVVVHIWYKVLYYLEPNGIFMFVEININFLRNVLFYQYMLSFDDTFHRFV